MKPKVKERKLQEIKVSMKILFFVPAILFFVSDSEVLSIYIFYWFIVGSNKDLKFLLKKRPIDK